MTYAEILRQKLNNDCNESINAAIYARVSTDNEGQQESCANQVDLAKNFISKHPNINLVEVYIDDGISAQQDFTRPEYNRMLQELEKGSFSLIITKALSRLNRNKYNAIGLAQLLIEKEATVFTLEDNQLLDFEDINLDLLYTLHFAIDEQYSRRQRINGKTTHELRCKNKILSAKDCSFGYDWNSESKVITINNEQATIVRSIFEDYVYRNETPANIAIKLKTSGILVPRIRKNKETKEKYIEHIPMCSKTISNIVKDERYKGHFYINKRSSKPGTGKTHTRRIRLPKEEWILIERPDLQIIDSDLFDMAQRIHQNRITIYEKPDKKVTQARFQGIHKYASKIFCPVCGKPYQFGYSDRGKTLPAYKIKSHSDCPNPVRRIEEAEIERITRIALKMAIEQQHEVISSLEAVLEDCIKATNNSDTEISKLKKQISLREDQIDTLINTLSEGGLIDAAKDRIKEKINTTTEEIDSLKTEIKNKESLKQNPSFVKNKILQINTAIEELKNFKTIDRERILNYIERIEMHPNNDVVIALKTGQTVTVTQQMGKDFSD